MCLEHVSAGQIIYLYLQLRQISGNIYLVEICTNIQQQQYLFPETRENIFVFPFLTEVDLRKGWRGTNCDQVDDEEKQVNPYSSN